MEIRYLPSHGLNENLSLQKLEYKALFLQKLYSSNFIKGIEKFIKTNLFFANVVSICIIPISSQLKKMMMQALVLSHYLMMSWGSNAVIGFFCFSQCQLKTYAENKTLSSAKASHISPSILLNKHEAANCQTGMKKNLLYAEEIIIKIYSF